MPIPYTNCGCWRYNRRTPLDFLVLRPAIVLVSIYRNKLRQTRLREGRYLLRTNLIEQDPAKLWGHYLLLTAVEEAFKNLKGDLAIRPVFHQLEARIEAHVFVAFLAYCLHVTLARRLHALAPGLTPRKRVGEVCCDADDRRASADD